MPSRLGRFNMIGLFLILLALSYAAPARAKDTLVVVGDRVTVYTGPGKYYRPLTVLPIGAEVQFSPKTIETKGGEFYKVLVRLSNKKKAAGYLPVSASVKRKKDLEDADDLETFKAFPLAEQTVHLSYTHFKTQRMLASIGFAKYIAPGFYVKGWAGAFRSPLGTAPVAGPEFGNDAILFGPVSGWISFASGVFLTPKENILFPGNKEDFSNFIVQTAMGLRYNFGETASFAFGGTQAVLFSANNSAVTWGLIAILEWGM